MKKIFVIALLCLLFCFLWLTVPALRIYKSDERLGWTGMPNVTTRMHVPVLPRLTVQSFTVRTNNLGFRDDDVRAKKTKQRVLILGDSLLWGLGVDNKNMASEILEKKLFRGKTEVINMAMNAYSTDQEFLVFSSAGKKYKPDNVFLFFYPNDVLGNLCSVFYRSKKPKFVMDEGKLQLIPAELAGKDDPDSRNVALNCKKDEDFTGFLKTYPAEYERGVRLTEEIILRLFREVSATGARFFLFYAPHFAQIYDSEWKHSVDAMHVPDAGMERYKLQNILRAFCRRNGIAFVDMTPVFQKRSRAEYDFFNRYHGHWNEKGNALAAEIMYSAINDAN